MLIKAMSRLLPTIITRVYLTNITPSMFEQLNIGYCSTRDGSLNIVYKIPRIFIPEHNLLSCMMVHATIALFKSMSGCKIFVSHDVNHVDSRISIKYHFKTNTLSEELRQDIEKAFKSIACEFWQTNDIRRSEWGVEDSLIYFYMIISQIEPHATYRGLVNTCDKFCDFLNDSIVSSGLFSIPSFYRGCYGNCV